MQVSYHKAIIEDCDYKIIMFYLYVYILSFQFWYMQCALTHEVSRHKDGDRAGGGSDKEECADGIQCRQSRRSKVKGILTLSRLEMMRS